MNIFHRERRVSPPIANLSETSRLSRPSPEIKDDQGFRAGIQRVPREGHRLRIIECRDPETRREFMFLTTEPDLPPGVLAELYRRRWEVEKVYDEIKNKLGARKAWESSQEAHTTQRPFVALGPPHSPAKNSPP